MQINLLFNGVIITKIARNVTLVLTIAATVISCLGLNLMGGYAFLINGYENCGYALFISSVILIAAVIIAAFKKVIIPLLLNIVGSAFYIYSLTFLAAIPNTKIPSENIEKLMSHHYPTIAVTVLLALLIFFNFMTDEAVKKRHNTKMLKKSTLERELSDDEKIM